MIPKGSKVPVNCDVEASSGSYICLECFLLPLISRFRALCNGSGFKLTTDNVTCLSNHDVAAADALAFDDKHVLALSN